MVTDLRFERVTALPLVTVPNTIYFVKGNASPLGAIYVTSTLNVAVPCGLPLVAGDNVTFDYSGGVLTISATGGGGGGGDMYKSQNLSGLANYATARANMGLTIGTDVQAYDADLAAIAALTTQAFGRGLLTLVDAAALRAAGGLVIGTDVQAYDADLAAIAALTTTTYGRALLTLADAAAGRTAFGLGSISTFAEATAAEYRAATASRALSAANVWAAGAVVALTDATTIAVDMSTFLNGSVTIAGNRTLGNPTNPKVGQSGFIRITQDATGSRTLAYASNWKYAGGIGSIPALSTAAAAVDVLTYLVLSSTEILITGIQKAIG